ncbi:MAG TPA: 3-isopropylmalate dehydratase small subunit [Candidatus Acidoferrales bacterium]|nr:3-isopropylmalate dehydratase small subunit [Candidatus Acidoferrales bacterium]
MQHFREHTGLVAPMDRVNVDTDQMVPKQFCKLLTNVGYERMLFYDWRYLPGTETPDPAFVLNLPRYQGASILLTRRNFGCGSSREHAAWAVRDYGFRAVIGPSFADIFFGNCFRNGVLAIPLPQEQVDELFRRVDARPGYRLHIDLPNQVIRDDSGLEYKFEINPFGKEALLKGLDEIGLTCEHEAEIAAYEHAHNPRIELHGEVDFSLPAAS